MPTTSGILEKASQEFYNDFLLFSKSLLTYHGIMTYDFSDVHEEVISHILANRYALIILPRGHLKTTILNCYALWRLFRHRNYEVCMVSSTLDQSMNNLAFIQKMIETTPWLKKLAPSDSSTSWNKSRLTTANDCICYVRPFSSSARGIHPNEILYDDILREADVSMEDIKDIFWNVFFPMGQTKGCKHVVVGTPMTADDLFVEIEEKAKKNSGNIFGWAALKRRAIILDINGKSIPLWDARFTLEELEIIKEDMGQYRFNREFLCDPRAAGSGFFPTELVINTTYDDMAFTYNTEGVIYIGADFAMSESASGDYNVFTVIECKKGDLIKKRVFDDVEVDVAVKDPVIIRRIERYKGATGQVRILKELYDAYNAKKIILDVSQFGKRFAQELREVGVDVDAQDFRPANRAQLLANLRKLFETEDPIHNPARIMIPTSQIDFTFDKTKVLLKEMSGFEETRTRLGQSVTIASKLAHDDTVMSLALAVKDVGYQRSFTPKIIYSFGDKKYPIGGYKNIHLKRRIM